MAWYLSYYHCTDCGTEWTDEWSACCDDECPNCGSRNWSPHKVEDLTAIVEQNGDAFVVYRSPDVADDKPKYAEIARFATAEQAENYAEIIRRQLQGHLL